jgi:pyridoxal 5'-phosphate synthase pdxT subunit
LVVPRIGILALQGDVREHRRMFQELEYPTVDVKLEEDFAAIDALVIPGGESTTMSTLAAKFDLWPALHSARDQGMPMFGTCAGMIMLAKDVQDGRSDQHTIGALDVTVRRNAFGRQIDSFESPIDLPPVDIAQFPGVFIRAPWIERSGPGVEILGYVDSPSHGGTIVAVRSESVLATAFHPELTVDTRIHALFGDMVRSMG